MSTTNIPTPGDVGKSLLLAAVPTTALPVLDPDKNDILEEIQTRDVFGVGKVDVLIAGTLQLSESSISNLKAWMEKIQKEVNDADIFAHLQARIDPVIHSEKLRLWKEKTEKIVEKSGESIQEKRTNLRKMEQLWEERVLIAGVETADDRVFQDRIKKYTADIESLQKSIDDAAMTKVEELKAQLTAELDRVLGPEGINVVVGGTTYRELTSTLGILSSTVGAQQKTALEELVRGKRLAFRAKKDEEEKAKVDAERHIVNDIERGIRMIKDMMQDVSDVNEVPKIQNSPEVERIREQIALLKDTNQRHMHERNLAEIFESAETVLKLKHKDGKVDLGDGVELAVFTAQKTKPLAWQIKFKHKEGKVDVFFEAHETGSKNEHEPVKQMNPHGGPANGQVVQQIYHKKYPLRVTEDQLQRMNQYIGSGKKIHKVIVAIRLVEAIEKLEEAIQKNQTTPPLNPDQLRQVVEKELEGDSLYSVLLNRIRVLEKRNGQAGIQEIIEGIKKDLKGKDEYWKEAQKLLPRGQKNKAITSIDEVEKDLYLARMFEHLPTRNHLSRYRVPQIPTTAVMGPTTKGFLKEFGELADIQSSTNGEGNGITIIEGEAGTGKNYKINIFAALTNREVFEMSGNKTATKGDMLYSTEIGPDGTYRAATELIRGIQTPGAVIVLDEINTYPPEVLKLLNPLLAGGRYINDPQKGKIKCHPSVVICGTMNPSHYIGTQPLAQELKSRARIIHDKYPPEELPDRSKNWEEALTIARHSVNLGSIRADEFIKGWAEKQQSLNGVWPPIMQQHASVLRSLESYIEFVNEMRRIYTETQTNQATNDEFHFPISLREGIQIMYEYDRAPGLGYKAAVLAVIEPKISGQDADMVEKEKKLLRDKVQAIIK